MFLSTSVIKLHYDCNHHALALLFLLSIIKNPSRHHKHPVPEGHGGARGLPTWTSLGSEILGRSLVQFMYSLTGGSGCLGEVCVLMHGSGLIRRGFARCFTKTKSVNGRSGETTGRRLRSCCFQLIKHLGISGRSFRAL